MLSYDFQRKELFAAQEKNNPASKKKKNLLSDIRSTTLNKVTGNNTTTEDIDEFKIQVGLCDRLYTKTGNNLLGSPDSGR
ncbi:MAG: hypothetical protein ACMUEM_04000 [Flavobacteriales bacterium AspAUS03]